MASLGLLYAGMGPGVALIEEGAQQEDDGDVLVVTEALPSTARSTGQGASGQGALVRNILEAEKALQVALPLNAANSHLWVLIGNCLQSRTILQRSTCLCARFVGLKMHIGAIQTVLQIHGKSLAKTPCM